MILKFHFRILVILGYLNVNMISLIIRVKNRSEVRFYSNLEKQLLKSKINKSGLLSSKLKSIISSQDIVNEIELALINKYYLNQTILNDQLETIVEYLIQNLMSTQKKLFLARLFSRFGFYYIQTIIEENVISTLQKEKFNNVYDFFLYYQISIFNGEINTQIFPFNSRKIIRFLNNFYKYEYISSFLNINNSKTKHLLILGPLRQTINFTHISKDVAIVKPVISEIEELKNSSLMSNVYLYFNTIKNKLSFNESNFVYVKSDTKESIKSFTNIKNLEIIDKYNNELLFNGYPMHLQRVLIERSINSTHQKFNLMYFNFYLDDKVYSEKYFSSIKSLSHTNHDERRVYIYRLAWHNLISNFRLSKSLYTKNVILKTKYTNKILNLSTKEYAKKLEKLFNTYD